MKVKMKWWYWLVLFILFMVVSIMTNTLIPILKFIYDNVILVFFSILAGIAIYIWFKLSTYIPEDYE